MSEPSTPLKFMAGAALVAGLAFGGAAMANAQADTGGDDPPTTVLPDESTDATDAPAVEPDVPAEPEATAPDTGSGEDGTNERSKPDCDRDGSGGSRPGRSAGASTESAALVT